MKAIKNDKFEIQVLKYFDFSGWAETKFTATKKVKNTGGQQNTK